FEANGLVTVDHVRVAANGRVGVTASGITAPVLHAVAHQHPAVSFFGRGDHSGPISTDEGTHDRLHAPGEEDNAWNAGAPGISDHSSGGIAGRRDDHRRAA